MIYFDNSATTKPYSETIALMAKLMEEAYANSSSMHALGLAAEKILESSRKELASLIKALPEELVFTSGGTESINTALRGSSEITKRAGRHILASPVEHPASLESLNLLASQGWEIEWLTVDSTGTISLSDLESKLRKDTVLVNLMHVNNEFGTIEPVVEAGERIKRYNPAIAYHVDAVQSFGKIPISVKSLKADFISVSAHKIHGPKGVGLLYSRKGTRFAPLLLGGGHERNQRSGTVNVPGIAAFSLSASIKHERRNRDEEQMKKVRLALLDELEKRLPGQYRVNSPQDGTPGILNVSFKGIKAEILLHSLEAQAIFVSSGSACHSRHDGISHVIKAAGVPKEWEQGAIRFSFSGDNTIEEASVCGNAVAEALDKIRIRR